MTKVTTLINMATNEYKAQVGRIIRENGKITPEEEETLAEKIESKWQKVALNSKQGNFTKFISEHLTQDKTGATVIANPGLFFERYKAYRGDITLSPALIKAELHARAEFIKAQQRVSENPTVVTPKPEKEEEGQETLTQKPTEHKRQHYRQKDLYEQTEASKQSFIDAGRNAEDFIRTGMIPALQTAQYMFLEQPWQGFQSIGNAMIEGQKRSIKNLSKQ